MGTVSLSEKILKALEKYPGGVTAKTLAGDVRAPADTVVKTLQALKKTRRVEGEKFGFRKTEMAAPATIRVAILPLKQS